MTLDTILVVIAVTMMFATLAVVLGWADKYTQKPRCDGAQHVLLASGTPSAAAFSYQCLANFLSRGTP